MRQLHFLVDSMTLLPWGQDGVSKFPSLVYDRDPRNIDYPWDSMNLRGPIFGHRRLKEGVFFDTLGV
jgi:hypothetical protein